MYSSGAPSSCHDLAEHDSSGRALRLNNDSGTRLFPVSTNPVLISECQSANPGALDNPSYQRCKDLSRGNIQNVPEVDLSRGCDYSNKSAHPRAAVLTPSTNLLHTSGSSAYKPDASWLLNKNETTVLSSNFDPSLPSSTVAATTSTEASRQSPESTLTYIDSATAAESITVPCLPFTTHIRMCLCGELFSYDLRNLQSDPREIVELLTCTGSERGNWMIVGASYRRQGNPHAAMAVLNAMLEVMARHAIPEHELKPAFLLLSSCESDLVKLTQGKNTLEHRQKSQTWLQKVYGTMKSAPATSPLATRHQQLGLPLRPRSPSPRPDYREIQSLRDRLQHQTDLLADVSAKKRKLEDFYDTERDTRRRLEREIDDLKRERDDAHRLEMSALEQMKREIEHRRRAEDNSLRERDLRVEMERYGRMQRRSPSPYRVPAPYAR